MFQTLFAHLQEALFIQKLVYFVRIYVGWLLPGLEWNSTPNLVAASRQNIPTVLYAVPPEDEQIVFETCRGCIFVIN
jgi:hypothetical protein